MVDETKRFHIQGAIGVSRAMRNRCVELTMEMEEKTDQMKCEVAIEKSKVEESKVKIEQNRRIM